MAKYLRVIEAAPGAPGQFYVEDEHGAYYYHGNAEQVHSWLGREGYAKVTDVEGITAWYKRAVVSAVS